MHVLLHISDIHLEAGHELKPTERVVAAMRGLNVETSTVTIVLTGDVAYSGKQNQYEAAHKYFSELRDAISTQFGTECQMVVCPGNHDCDFPDDTAVRDLVVNQIRSQGVFPKSEEMVRQCTRVQSSFFEWVERIDATMSERGYRLAWIADIHGEGGARISFRVLNSAWMSTAREQQGQLFFPISQLPDIPHADVRISILHHTYNWFESTNGRELRRILEDTSDLVITGHEHDTDEYVIARRFNETTGYVEGGVFGGNEEKRSSFNLIQIDLHNRRYCVTSFSWRGDSFTADCAEPEWRQFVSTTSSLAREHQLSEDMRRFLADPDLPLTHRAKSIDLEDIFVPPDLSTYKGCDKAEAIAPAVVPSELSMNTLFEDRYAYLLGEWQCGKTALAKMLFLHAVRRGLIPIFLVGEHIRKPSGDHLKKLVDDAIHQQYSRLPIEEFWQLAEENRMVIVDNFAEATPNAKGKAQVAGWLKNQFGRAFLFGGDLTQIEDLVAGPDEETNLRDFKRYEIRPFGHLLRDLLIEKWITLGKEHLVEQAELHHELRQTANIINRLLGDNLFPPNPVYILMLLQQLEANIPLDTIAGSYGYFYEAVLTLALQRPSRSPEDVDTKYTYLSELAWHIFREGRREIDEEDIDSFTRRHCEGFQLTKNSENLKREILESRVLQSYYGKHRFVNRCFFYYFVARYMRDNIEHDDVQSCIKQAAQEMHREDFANILIFFTFLTKSKYVINLVLNATKALFKGVSPCNLADHVAFIGRLQDNIPSVVLPEGDPKVKRRDMLKELDGAELGSMSKEEDTAECQQAMDDEEEMGLLLSVNQAIKALQVLGQILRNFSGSLRRELKVEIIRECFDLALRVLNSFYNSLERHLDTTLGPLADLFGKNLSELPEKERVKVAKEFLFFVTEMMCLATLHRISYAVGSESLGPTYQDVEDTYNNRATRFVQLSLRLDHFRGFPEKRALELLKEVKDDVFGLTLLRILVAEHFYLFPRPYRTRQSICQKLGISYQRTLEPRKAQLLTGKRGR